MTLRTRSAGSLKALSLCFAAACAANSAPVATRVELAPIDFYPLRAGSAWSYDVDTGEPSSTLAVTRVVAVDGTIVEVRTANTIARYEVLPEGIRALPGDAWLIRAPVRRGATWPAPGGRTAEVVSTEVAAEPAAGRFDGCAEVRELGGKLDLEVRTVYCPGVGPVSVTSTMQSNVSDRVLTVSARLRGYTVSSRVSGP